MQIRKARTNSSCTPTPSMIRASSTLYVSILKGTGFNVWIAEVREEILISGRKKHVQVFFRTNLLALRILTGRFLFENPSAQFLPSGWLSRFSPRFVLQSVRKWGKTFLFNQVNQGWQGMQPTPIRVTPRSKHNFYFFVQYRMAGRKKP